MVMVVVMVATWEIFSQAWRRRHRCGTFDVPQRGIACKRGGRDLIQVVMMVVMMTRNVSSLYESGTKGRNALVMVVPFRLLGTTSNWRQPSIHRFILLLLWLSPLPPACCLRSLYRRLLWDIQLITAEYTSIAVCQLGPCWNRAGNGADSSPYTGEHASKFALDPWLASRAGELRLSSLDSLWKRGNSPLAVDLLNPKQVPLMAVRSAHLLQVSVP